MDLVFENCGLFWLKFSNYKTYFENCRFLRVVLKTMDFYAWIFQNLDLVFENCGLFCIHFSKLWTFTCEFFNICTSILKIVDFSAYLFQNDGLLHVNFDIVFENCGLLCIQFSKWWTFTRGFFKIWTSFLKNVDFSAYIFQNYGLLSMIFFNLDLDFENCGLLRATF